MTARMIPVDGGSLWTEAFGDPGRPTVLLIMGATAPALFWEASFCEALAERGFHVIRFDNRDTGCSVVSTGLPTYTVRDMAADALAVLDGYDVRAAHLVGASMGGGIAQYLALEHADRVLTLTLLFSTPVLRELVSTAMGLPSACELPMPDDPELLAFMQESALDPPLTREAQIAFDLRRYGMLAGKAYPFDEAHWTRLLTECHDRCTNWAAGNNHHVVMAQSDPDLRPRLRNLDVPTLVVHGTDDLAIPFEHGVALSETIPGAELLELEGFGHQFHPDIYPLWAAAISAHAGARQATRL